MLRSEAEKEVLILIKQLNKLQDMSSHNIEKFKNRQVFDKRVPYTEIAFIKRGELCGFEIKTKYGYACAEILISEEGNDYYISSSTHTSFMKALHSCTNEDKNNLFVLMSRFYLVTEFLIFEHSDIKKYLSVGLDILFAENIKEMSDYFVKFLALSKTNHLNLKEQVEYLYFHDLLIPQCLADFLASPKCR
ncbi:hypothetical protein ALO82_200309 [Pseudomonas syringae pv. broussonetiae]|uniref:Uncharacterized protein n=1 Tax=Pseudomonas savastanoi TaxID=29438 RepID=A0A3M5JEW6_PSESS|nr:hypothetical protein [Pseudomonas savastanoi]KPW62919.1 hypothetical protein ALO82_200309 [Pseudomonas syringae pv. broussonetiae]KWT09452.1 hypothetical protein AL047_16410 [Pseudomonas syringae pv. broussonetiae]RMT21961.1 hypothetical protein ALP51_00891 [Pseudomonas savastanoi]